MRQTLISQIEIADNRQRQEFEPNALQELKNSIEDGGLQNAPVLRTVGSRLVLVSGERRLRAISEIFDLGGSFKYDGAIFTAGSVPYTLLGDLDELAAEEAELDENFRRKDLTWQEHAAALGRLHRLRQAQSVASGGPVHTVADTALEISGRSDGSFQDNVRKELIVARNLENTAISKAKNVDEAFKILKRQETQKANVELAAKVGLTFTASQHTLLHVDCLSFMQATDLRFDVICTDPPYGMGADEFGDAGGKLTGIEHHYKDDYESWQVLMRAWCPLSYRVAKPAAHAYVFCDFDRFHELKQLMQSAGWYVFRTPLIVHKQNSGRVPLPDRGPRRQYELVLYAIKGDRTVNLIAPDVLSCPADDNLSHGAQKPVAVFQNLLHRSVRPGDLVADFFAGTGPIFPAAHALQCTVVATEKTAEYFAISYQRLENLKLTEQVAA